MIFLIDTLRMITRLRMGRKEKPRGAKAPPLSPHLNEVTLLMKWLDKGFDSPKHNFFEIVEFSQKNPSSRQGSILFLLGQVFRNLPADNSSGSLMQYLSNMMTAKLKIAEKERQESFDVALGYLNLDLNFMALIREWLYPKRLEIH